MDPIAKLILNSIKCPQCKSPVDLMEWRGRSEDRKYNFCCAANWEHYRLFFIHWEPPIQMEYENVIIYDDGHKYSITQTHDRLSIAAKTEILIFDVDPENRVIEPAKGEKKVPKFAYDKKLFDFAQTSSEKILNRIKTILTFQ